MHMRVGLMSLLAGLAPASAAMAHGGEAGDHLAIGYYYGHDGTFEAPASPPQPPTLLVDTHPWELGDVVYELMPSIGLLQGWASGAPGFASLPVDEQEFDGHGFFSFLDPGYTHGAPDLRLHLDAITPGLTVLNPITLQPQTFPLALGGGEFHQHMQYFVPLAANAAIGQEFAATFHLSDANGNLADSEPFTIRFQVVPEPGSVVLMLGAVACVAVRRRRWR